jgi:aspartyl-tRNA(Asn)/glutamyl-tRNA(Gln) amidotransferase subunit B
MTRQQRSKEEAHDYRYFPEPDLPALALTDEWIDQVRASLPELPDARRARFIADYDLSRYDAGVLVEDQAVADYFERALQARPETVSPKLVANWVTGELFRLMKDASTPIGGVKIRAEDLVALIGMIAAHTITQTAAKQVFGIMWQTGRPAQPIVDELGLRQISDADQLVNIVAQVVADHPDAVAQVRAGKEATLRFLIGQVMKATRGKANPQLAEQLLRERIQP